MKPRNTNYQPGSISFASVFLGPKGDVGFFMNADFNKAKEIISKLIKKGKEIQDVEMGLDGDWNCNSMIIYEEGKFTKYDCHEGSQWAEPIIIVNYKKGINETYPVWFRELEGKGDFEKEQKLLNS